MQHNKKEVRMPGETRNARNAYRAALHQYARAMFGVLGVFGVQQVEVARQLGVSKGLVTLWLKGQKALFPHHEKGVRAMLVEVAEAQRPAQETPEAWLRFRDQLVAALMDLDKAAMDLELAFSRSVQAMTREITQALDARARGYARTPETASRLDEAYADAQMFLTGLPRILAGTKARNRALRALVEKMLAEPALVRQQVEALLDFLAEVYGIPAAAAGSQPSAPKSKAHTQARRRKVQTRTP
jgi:hypothetical protein